MDTLEYEYEMGTTGLKHYGGIIDEEILKDLEFPRCINVFRQMETDPLIGAALLAIRQFIMSSEWTVAPYEGSGLSQSEKESQAQFLRQCMFEDMDRPFSELLSEILTFLVYGFSFHEIVLKVRSGKNSNPLLDSKYNDGKFGFRDFPIRSQDTIEKFYMEHGRLTMINQQDYYAGVNVDIPARKLLHFRTNSYKNNPMGQSILRSAYRSYYFRRNFEVQEGIGAERDLTGIPILRAPSDYLSKDASDSQKQMVSKLIRIGQSMKNNEQSYVLLPSDLMSDDASDGKYAFDIQLLSSPGTRQLGLEQTIQRHDYRMMQSLAADFIMMGSQSVGSYALSSNKVVAFTTAIASYLDTIANQFNKHAIALLWEANGWDPNKRPVLKHSGIEKVDLEVLSTFLDKAGSGGFLTPDEGLERELREKANLPPLSESEIALARKKHIEQQQQANQAPASPEPSPGE